MLHVIQHIVINNRVCRTANNSQISKAVGEKWIFKWFSNKPYKNPNYFAQQTGEDMLELDERMLVHHFDKLTGPLKTKGGIPVEAMKVIKQVVTSGSDAVANGVTCCSNCRQDIHGAEFVECPICNKWWHVQCVPVGAKDDEEWQCSSCAAL